jgi:peptidoglycan hydrolase-like amidase
MKDQPKITVGIVDGRTEVFGHLNGDFRGAGSGSLTGPFSAKADTGLIVLSDGIHPRLCCSPLIRLTAEEGSAFRAPPGTNEGAGQTFTLFQVTIGNRFHWERAEDQTFQGDLILRLRKDGTLVAINEIPLEDYLVSVISSEMSGAAPIEFLKAHAILSRSWLLTALERKKRGKQPPVSAGENLRQDEELVRWYDREEHDLFDVCADDHCQRYQGVTKIVSKQAEEAVRETHGKVITYQGEVCDARYSKACGGLTDEFNTAWEDKNVPYLESISDASALHPPITTEAEALAWIRSSPPAYCNTQDQGLLARILPGLDRETRSFFRWRVDCSRRELEEILRQKSGIDFGTLQEIAPLRRGPSGRISRLKIVGSKRRLVVGKELEIRRWLSRSHLYSSAFVVTVKRDSRGEAERFAFQGAGWGHGVGLCQIGAAVMATRGFSAEQILSHYFRGTDVEKIY